MKFNMNSYIKMVNYNDLYFIHQGILLELFGTIPNILRTCINILLIVESYKIIQCYENNYIISWYACLKHLYQ